MGLFSISPTSSTGGGFKASLYFNAKSGRFEAATRELDDDGNYQTVKKKVDERDLSFLVDPDSFGQGFALAKKGSFEKIQRPLGEPPPNRPNEKWKARFCFDLSIDGLDDQSDERIIREFGSLAACVLVEIETLAEAIYADRPEGRVPRVKVSELKEIPTSRGTNYSPVFEVVEWIDAPPEFLGAAGVERGDDRGDREEEAVGVGAGDDDIIL